jgi:pimeloyl-ACP methyl ester carboxylesterase
LGNVRNSERYQQAEAALKDNPQVDTVIGHSLGGSVALELEQTEQQPV